MSLAKAQVEERPAAPQQEPDRSGHDEPEGDPLHHQLPDYQATQLPDYLQLTRKVYYSVQPACGRPRNLLISLSDNLMCVVEINEMRFE